MAQQFKDLAVWQKAMELVTEIYKVTDSFPQREVYSLTDQIRRAAVSVPSNIAEGQAHYSHLNFSISCATLQVRWLNLRPNYQSQNVSVIPIIRQRGLLQRVHQVGRILNGLIASLREHS